MRRINEIRDLPVSQLTDEEIVKAAFYRLKTKAILMIYEYDDGQYALLGRYKNKYRWILTKMLHGFELMFGSKLIDPKLNEDNND